MLNFDRSTVKHGAENIKNDCHQWLSDSFRVHQIRFRPGLCTGPCWGSLQRSPIPHSWFKGPTSDGEGQGRGRDRPPPFTQIPRSASAMGFFYDNVTGGGIRLKAHGRGIKRGTPGSRLAARHYPICIYC